MNGSMVEWKDGYNGKVSLQIFNKLVVGHENIAFVERWLLSGGLNKSIYSCIQMHVLNWWLDMLS